MTEKEKRVTRYQVLIQQLQVIVFYWNDLGLSKRQIENAIDDILDEMIEIRAFLKNN